MKSILAGLALSVGLSAYAAAETTSGTPFTVQVTVTAGCKIDSGPTGTINFGSVSGVAAAPADIGSSFAVTCTNTTPYKYYFTSVNTVTTAVNRVMVNGANTVGYKIKQGSTDMPNVATNNIGGTGNGASQTYPLTFTVTNWTPTAPGTYTDTVTLSVEF
jgi:spore coat protein U-like protein